MITCQEYDYVEVACLYRYPVRLTMKSGEILQGIALDTSRNENRKECIKISRNEIDMLIELDSIFKLQILADNPNFSEIIFK
ncbi:Rho-binding antiterminator [Vibrio sp. TH_r3]|uniref:Rho-binding antiterminator n=1 Tax=Vibrio sp. TH_r3 TaxID=3082084 RepID=UPI0029550C98|nr:Rho-binding antiterminator [Vibrio sp. TH_r3]MDV7104619.1 Rho-binding antiterminator [Vibrio sp. TH_r3]